MSQALQVLSSMPRPPSATAAVSAAESADSGQSFEVALASQRGEGEAAVAAEPAESANAPDPAVVPTDPAGADSLAASGKDLPPALPPEAAALVLAMWMPAAANPNAPVAGNTVGGADSKPVTAAPVLTGLLDDAGEPTMPAATLAAADHVDDKPAFALPATDAAPRPQTVSLPANDILAVSSDPLAALPPVRVESVVAAVENLKAGIEPAPGAAAEPRIPVLPIAAGVEPLTGPGGMTAATAPAPAGGQVNVPFGHAAWGQAFSNQVVWAMNQGLPTAALHLSPAELGPVSVQIRLDQDQASVSFVSAHAAVRDAIEAALPRLRDMLGAQGITLADVNVSQHGQSQHAQRDPAGAGYAHAGSMTDSGEELPAAPLAGRARGMLDVYV